MDKILSPIKARVLEYLKIVGVTRGSFYAKTGISASNFKGKGGESELGGDKIVKILTEYPDLSSEWLLKGEGEKIKTKSTESLTLSNGKEEGKELGKKPKVQNSLPFDESKIVSFPKDDQTRVGDAVLADEGGIPLIPLDAVAGFCTGDSVQVMEYECERYLVPNFQGADFLIPVKGDSMEPRYSSGDLVACMRLPLDTFFQWNKVYVVGSQQGVLIKRIKKGPDDEHITLVSENEEYEPFVLHRSELYSLAIVIGLIHLE